MSEQVLKQAATRLLRAVALLAALALGAGTADAQVRVPRPPAGTRRPPNVPPVQRAPGDTGAKKDTTLVTWAEPDSVMEALLAREGYAVTRYQGAGVVFGASGRTLSLVGDRAAVGRGAVLVVGDTIIYNDSLQIVTALGDTNTLRDPSQGEDIVSHGRIRYDIRKQTGVVTNISTAITQGERWILHGGVAAIARDTSAARRDAYYVKDGDITSCDDTIPHYHFRTTQMKVVAGNVIVARPAVLYIMDIPVMVLPFLFADISKGRHSGILTPRFGIAELLRNSPGYRRRVDNFGYYWDINHYMDASAWVNWLSNARPSLTENTGLFNNGAPGYFDYNGELNYRWIDRFMQGSLAASLLSSSDGSRTESIYWGHSQDFSLTEHLRMDLNYTTNTTTRQRTQTNYQSALATIRSSLSYQRELGPLNMSLGGSRTQYPGLKRVEQTYPQLSIVPRGAISVGDWLTWTPTLSGNITETLHDDQNGSGAFFLRSVPNGSGFGVDSSRFLPSSRTISGSFNTPVRIFNYEIPNSFSLTDEVVRGPSTHVAFAGANDTVGEYRTFGEFTRTSLDWNTGFSLPNFSQGKLNLTPSVSLSNVGPGAFFIRSTTSGGAWVHQTKRPTFSISSTPTLYGLFPGFGPVTRFRHKINPQISFSYAPAASVSREYLQAAGVGSSTSLLGIAQNSVQLGLTTNLEAKLRASSDTASNEAEARKVSIANVTFSGLSYNFEQLKERRRRAELAHSPRPNAFVGLNSSFFSYSATSELLPGFSLQNTYSLFTDDPSVVDTARFKPFRTQTNLSFSVNRQTNFIAAIARALGADSRNDEDRTRAQRATTGSGGAVEPDTEVRRAGAQPVAGSYARDQQFNVPTGRGFQGSFSLSSSRSRPIAGVRTISDADRCSGLSYVPGTALFQQCENNPTEFPVNAGTVSAVAGGLPTYQLPATTSINSQMSFNITPKWAATWGTNYDVENGRFGGQIVNLQRELHDWRAVFGFSSSPGGAFAFTFFISLNAEPDLKFNYDRRSYPNSF